MRRREFIRLLGGGSDTTINSLQARRQLLISLAAEIADPPGVPVPSPYGLRLSVKTRPLFLLPDVRFWG